MTKIQRQILPPRTPTDEFSEGLSWAKDKLISGPQSLPDNASTVPLTHPVYQIEVLPIICLGKAEGTLLWN